MTIAIAIDELDIDAIVANSFKDYTARGVDYICLSRTDERTDKLMIFGNTAPQSTDGVVAPHNHRYPLLTECIHGKVTNYSYTEGDGPGYTRWNWFTPLNGGRGFTHSGETHLKVSKTVHAHPGDTYWMPRTEIHTIRTVPGTVIRITQHADEIPVDEPTKTFTQSAEAPNLAGLYERFTTDEVVRVLRTLSDS